MNRYSVLLACTTALVGIVPYQAGALPQGGTVAAGSANITTGATNVDITQSTEKAVIDWQGFDVAPHESVNFAQPSANAITLNRVGSSTPSQIEGAMRANGNIIIVNPNGVVFSKDARVDVGGLVATTSDIGNQQFMQSANPEFTITGNPSASIINHGSITAAQGGLVGLVAPSVSNHGTIRAQLGRVTLASGDRFTLDLAGDGITQLSISDAVASQLVRNTGTIEANGGTITLTAAAARDTVDSLIENTGVLRATTVGEHEGTIILYAEGSNAVITNDPAQKGLVSGRSTVINSGTIDVSGNNAGEKAGTVKILGDQVALTSQARIFALGKAGGGVVRVGGDTFGQGTTPTAISTIMQSGALIDARSTLTGDAGSVVLWADNNTSFAGDIKADAEGEFGDGGFVETSGKAILNAYGTVSATSRRGKRGEWYLDPANITITTADANITGNPNFTATNTGSTVNAASIVSNLNAGTNVTITTSNDAFAGDGDIFVNSAITTTGTGSLTLSAYRNITVSAGITLAGGSLTLRADNSGIGSGAISVAAAIATAGGNITMGGGNGAITAGSGFATGNSSLVNGVLLSGATLNAGGGNIIINGRGITSGSTAAVGVLLSNNTISTTGTGTISITGVGGLTSGNSNIGISFTNANAVSTAGGNLSLNGTGGGTGSALTNHGIYINSANAVTTTGAGNILVTAQGGHGNTTNSTSTGFFDNVTNALRTTGTGGITINATGGGAAQAGTDNYAFFHQGSISSNGGAILINANGAAAPSGDRHYGAFIGGNISNANGDITINATAGNAGSNNPGYRQNAGIINAGTGQITITGTRGGSGLDDYAVTGGTIGGAGQSGNITLLGNRYSVTSWSVATTGTLTVAPRTSITMDVGGSSASLNISNALLGFFSAGSYVFGSTTTGNLTVNTTNNFGNSNVTFLSGTGDVSVSGAYTSTGNGALTLSAFRHVLTTAAISLNGGAATLRSNNTGAATGVIDIGAALSTSGGNITMGGGSGAITAGSGYTLGNSGRVIGVNLSGAINAGGGNILINGRGAIGINGFVHGVNVGLGSSLTTTNNGTITLHGIGEGDATSGQTIGVFVNNNASITAQHGNITLTGTGGAGTQALGVATSTTGASVSTSGNGNIIITGTGGASANSQNHGISTNATNGVTTSGAGSIYLYGTKGGSTSVGYNSGATNGVVTTGTGNVFVYADTLGLGFANGIVSANSLTIAPLTNAATMAVGTTGSTLSVSNTDLSRVSAASYTFGSTTTGNITVNTTRDFGDRNVTFLSGGNIVLASNFTKASGTGTANYLFRAHGDITNSGSAGISVGAGFGSANITLQSDFDGNNDGAITLTNGALTSRGGNITLGGGSGTITAGNGYAAGNATNVSGVLINGTGVSAGGGNIVINGRGANLGTNLNHGVDINGSGAQVNTTGTGTITINGIGGGGTGNSAQNIGVQLANGSNVNTENGQLSITGVGGGAGSGASNMGVNVTGTGSSITSSGSGLISVQGTGGNSTGSGGNNFGVRVDAVNGIRANSNGQITINGLGGSGSGSGTTGVGVSVAGGSIVGGGNTVTITGTGAASSGAGNYGIRVTGATGAITNTGTGAVLLNATAGGSSTSGTNYGLYVDSGARVATADGALTITAQGGGSTGNSNYGVYVIGASGIETTGTGTLTINATAGGSGASSSNAGIYITDSGSYIRATSTGNVSLTGNGGTTNGSGIVVISGADITANGGTLSANGTGGSGTADSNFGVQVTGTGSTISNTGNGTIAISGTAGGTGNSNLNRGVQIDNAGVVSTANGNITVTGVAGGAGTGNNNFGVRITNTGSSITSGNGSITITGTENATSGSQGISLGISDAVRTTGSGNITLLSNSFGLGNTNNANAAGVLTVATRTGTTMAVGTTGSTLNLSNTDLSYLNGASFVFGSTTTGNLTVNTTRDFADKNVTFLSGGNIVLAGSLTKASGTGTATYLFRAHGDITNSGSAGIITNSGSSNITLHSDFDDNNNGAINFTNGSITSNGGSITLGGGSNITTDYAYGNATNTSGVALNGTDVNAGAGTLTVRGRGRDAGTLTYGVLVNSGAKLRGTGTINVTGLGGSGTDDSYGIYVNGTNSAIAGEGAGTVTLNGTGQGSGTRSAGVRVQSGGVVSVVSGGTLNITGHSSGLGDNERGVIVSGTNSAMRGTGTGIVNITGTVANSGTGTGHVGVYANSLGIMSTVDGLLTINGTGGGGTSSGNSYGVVSVAGGQIRTTGAGNLLITGQGGTLGTTVGNNHGIVSQNAGGIETTGSGSITLNGTAGAPASSFGVYTDAAGGIRTTGSGNITVNTDTLLTTTSGALNSINTLTIAPRTNAGTLAVGTTGSTLNLSNTELANHTAASYIFGNNTTGDITVNTTRDFGNGNVTFTTPANITLSGNLTKASGAGTADYIFNGNTVNLNTNNTITATSGAINLSFTGAGNLFTRNNTLSTNGGSITLSKNAFLQSGTLTLNSAGGNININNTLNGTIADTQSLTVNAGAGTFTTAAAMGGSTRLQNLSVTADNVALGGNLSGSGTLTLQPTSTTRVTRLNYGVGDFNLDATELGYIQNGWSQITIGRLDSTAIAYYGASSWSDNVTFQNNFYHQTFGDISSSDNANITFANGRIDLGGSVTSAGNLTFNATTTGAGSGINAGTGTNTLSAAGDLYFATLYRQRNTVNPTLSAGNTLTLNGGAAIFVGAVTNLTASANTLIINGSVGGSGAYNAVTLTAANSISLPSITAGSILVRTTGATADLTLASGTTLTASGAGNALTLVAGRNFINNSGSTALSTPSGRWLVYSTSMAANTRGGLLPDASNFGQTYAGNPPASIGAGNRFIYSSSTRPTLVYDVNDGSVTYGDTYTHTNGITYASGLLAGDTLGTIGLTGSASFGSTYVAGTTNASTTPYAGMITGSTNTLASVLGYDFSFTAGDLTVNRRTITPTLAGTVSKTYDGNTTANFASGNFTLANTIGGDDISVAAGTGTYTTKDAATGKNVSITGLTLSGTDAGNYLLSTTSLSGAIGTITQRSATITVANASRQQGNANPAFSASYAGLVGGDTSAVISGLTFNTAALTNSPIGTYAITASGATATNYTFTYVNGVLTITAGSTAPTPDPTPAPTTTTTTTTLSQLVEQKRRIEDTITAESSINTFIIPGSTTGSMNNVIIIENRLNSEPNFSTFNPASDCESCTTL